MLVECPECNRKISSDAKVCPKCGADVESRNATNNTLAGIVIFLVIIFSLLKQCSSGKDEVVSVISDSPVTSENAEASPVAHPSLAKQPLTFQEKLMLLVGEPSNVAPDGENTSAYFTGLFMGREMEGRFRRYVAESKPIEDAGDYLFGSGCSEGKCGSEEAAFTIDKKSGKWCVVILDGGEFKLFGAQPDSAPEPLRVWRDKLIDQMGREG